MVQSPAGPAAAKALGTCLIPSPKFPVPFPGGHPASPQEPQAVLARFPQGGTLYKLGQEPPIRVGFLREMCSFSDEISSAAINSLSEPRFVCQEEKQLNL